jgi:hypothetical protein
LGGRYVAGKGTRISDPLLKWSYFDRLDVDWLDQLDRNQSSIPDGRFWPKNAKVKKLVYLSAMNAPVVTVLVCYALPALAGDLPLARRIMLVALKGTWTDRGYQYRELWTKTLEKESNYGEITLQDLPDIGRVLVLYSAAPAASSETQQLDIYRIE